MVLRKIMYISILLLFNFITVKSAFVSTEAPPKCGYESCTGRKAGMLNVHLVCHSHDDVGWLKTVDQYFYGARNDIQHAGVQYILDSVVDQLLQDPKKKFSFCESAYLSRWLSHQPDHKRHLIQNLVFTGQLEIIGGGWSSNDEAAAHYSSIIDQMTLGFNFLRGAFGDCGRPRVAWQVDTFGHSREQASLFSQMGFDGLFIGRLDYQDKENRINKTTMEFVWKASNNLGVSLFSGILPNGYNPPGGFCFDQFCDDPPIMDDSRFEEYNVVERVDNFIKSVKDQAKQYITQDLVMTMGSDFMFENANVFMKNLDKLIKYVNARQTNGSNINVFYSTPGCYLFALNQANKTWSTKNDDFFPYASESHAYWTGYFVSRPASKYQERKSNNFLQVCKQMSAISNFLHTSDFAVDFHTRYLKDALGIMQHHDAITGTAKQAVANDYSKRLARGVDECQVSVQNSLSILMSLDPKSPAPKQEFCNMLNVSDCAVAAFSNSFTVTVYNPLARGIQIYLHIPVSGKSYTVQTSEGVQLESQIVPLSPAIINLPDKKTKSTSELVFGAEVPPVGFNTYFVSKKSEIRTKQKSVYFKRQPTLDDIVMQNEFLSLVFDGASGKLKSFANIVEKINISMTQSFYWYASMKGNNSKEEFQASGAYIFRPNGSQPLLLNEKVEIHLVQGSLVQEVHQRFNSWLSQVIRLTKGQHFVEFDWVVGPIPINDSIGKEIVTRFDTNLPTKSTFYTDANGREIIQRVRNYRPTWKLNITEPVSCNYYPVTSRIFIQDNQAKMQLTVLTDRSQGGSSQVDGSLELMIHRRILNDDAKGVGEPLNETGIDGNGLIIRGKHYVMLNSVAQAPRFHRLLAQNLYSSPGLSFTNSTLTPAEWKKQFRTQYSALNVSLPPNVHLLTTEHLLGHKELLIRLEHIFEKNEDAKLSQPVKVNLENLFNGFVTTSAVETTLGANLPIQDLHRLKWNTKDGDTDYKHQFKPVKDLTVILVPMEIRTFFLTLSMI